MDVVKEIMAQLNNMKQLLFIDIKGPTQMQLAHRLG